MKSLEHLVLSTGVKPLNKSGKHIFVRKIKLQFFVNKGAWFWGTIRKLKVLSMLMRFLNCIKQF